MTLSLFLLVYSLSSMPTCKAIIPGKAAAVPTEAAAMVIAKRAWSKSVGPDELKQREPYRAVLTNGAWHVVGTLPKGLRGGSPEAFICASDGKILKVFQTQ